MSSPTSTSESAVPNIGNVVILSLAMTPECHSRTGGSLGAFGKGFPGTMHSFGPMEMTTTSDTAAPASIIFLAFCTWAASGVELLTLVMFKAELTRWMVALKIPNTLVGSGSLYLVLLLPLRVMLFYDSPHMIVTVEMCVFEYIYINVLKVL